jgi:hypothetical protein
VAVADQIPQFFQTVVLPHFFLTAEHEQMIGEDLFGFLHETDAVPFEFLCPISAARDFMALCGLRPDWLNAALDIALAELRVAGSVSRWYGALLFAGSALEAAPIGYWPPALPDLFALACRSDHFVLIAGFDFLIGQVAAHLAPGADLLATAIEILCDGHPLRRYAAAIAIAKLVLPHMLCFGPEVALEVVQLVLALNQEFPTDAMAGAVRIVCDAFTGDLVPLAVPVADALFALLREYSAMDPGQNELAVTWIHGTIETLLRQMDEQDQDFWDFCVSQCRSVETLTLLSTVVKMAPAISPSFAGIPDLLLELAQSCMADGDCMNAMAEVIVWLSLREPGWLASADCFPIVQELLRIVLVSFDGHEMDLCDCDGIRCFTSAQFDAGAARRS